MVQSGPALQPAIERGSFVLIGSNISLHQPYPREGTASVTHLPAGTIVQFDRAEPSESVLIEYGVIERDALLWERFGASLTLSESTTLGPAGLVLAHHTLIPSAMMLAGDLVLKSDTLLLDEPRFPDRQLSMQGRKVHGWPKCRNDIWPCGTVFPTATILPANTILVKGTHIPGGTVIPKGTTLSDCVLPMGTIPPRGMVVQRPMRLFTTHLRDFKPLP